MLIMLLAETALLELNVQHSPKAKHLITGSVDVLVTDIVLSEDIWVLTGKRYNLSRNGVVDVIHALFAERNLKFEDP
jgi:predicted nucleic acid-binding protein